MTTTFSCFPLPCWGSPRWLWLSWPLLLVSGLCFRYVVIFLLRLDTLHSSGGNPKRVICMMPLTIPISSGTISPHLLPRTWLLLSRGRWLNTTCGGSGGFMSVYDVGKMQTTRLVVIIRWFSWRGISHQMIELTLFGSRRRGIPRINGAEDPDSTDGDAWKRSICRARTGWPK